PHHSWNTRIWDWGGAFYQSEPMMEFMVRSVREGQSPYWNPYSAAGSLGPETLVDNKFSAFTLVHAVLGGGQKIYNAVFLALYFLAAYFIHRLIREKLQLSFLAALAGILFFLLNGYATANVGSNINQSYLFVPVCLYASFSFLEKPTAWRIVGVVLAFAAFFSYTFIPTTLTGFAAMYVVVLGYALTLYRKAQVNIRSLLRILAAHAACVFASILLLALLYFPLVENLHSTGTVGLYSDRGFRSLSWITIPSVFSPSHFFESYWAMEQGVVDYTVQTDRANKAYHFGTTALILAICSISLKRRDLSPFVLICMIAILIGFGRVFGVPGISSLISKIPVISFMISIHYWWPIIQIPLILLVALGVDNLQKRLVLPGLPFLLLALLAGSLLAVDRVYGLHEPNLWYKKWSISLLLATGVVASLATTLSAYTSRDRLRNYLASALVILAFVELTMDSKTMRYASDDLFTNPPTEIAFINESVGPYRTLTINYAYGMWHELGSAFGIQEVTAINQGTLPTYMEYFHHMISLDESQRRSYDYYPSLATMQDTPDINTIDWAAVDLLGIKYIIAPMNFTQYRQVFLAQGLMPVLDTGSLSIYQNPHVLPRAFTVDIDADKAISLSPDALSKLEPADITLYRNNEVVLTGNVNKPSLLILTDNWHSNWKAFVNGAQTDILLVEGAFRGVPVPAGPYQVRFRYQPRTLPAAILTSGLILLLLVYSLVDHKRIDSFLTSRFASLSL
ncbi:MAG: YfhO family protein, partial [Anaerolineales bacterium]